MKCESASQQPDTAPLHLPMVSNLCATGMTREQLYAKLQQLAATRQIRPIRLKVVNFLIRYELEKIRMADETLLAELYNAADSAPRTSTKHHLKTSHDIIFSGPCTPG